MKNLAMAILKVMDEVKGIDKSMTVGSGASSYKGVPDQEVKKIIGESMQRNGLTILPLEVTPTTRVERWEETYNGQTKVKQSIFTEVTTKYLLLHESGESQVISGYGHGIDSQDKGAGKATTYALKYTLLYLFLTPTGKIDDADTTHSDNIETPKHTSTREKTVNKLWLNPNTDLWNQALRYIREGGDVVNITKKYAISKENLQLLIKQSEEPA